MKIQDALNEWMAQAHSTPEEKLLMAIFGKGNTISQKDIVDEVESWIFILQKMKKLTDDSSEQNNIDQLLNSLIEFMQDWPNVEADPI